MGSFLTLSLMVSLLTSPFIVMSPLTTPSVVTSPCPSGGPTEHLRDVLTGRCVEYKSSVNPSAMCRLSHEVNCTSLVETFIDSFAGQPPCNISMTRYDAFLSETRHQIPQDKSLFWSGVYGTVHRYSQRGSRMVTLEDTLTGYMIDGLRFCSDPGKPGGIGNADTSFCPTFDQTDTCRWNAEASFWSAASKNFASKAHGTITVMLNASTGTSFRDASYFATWELPNLDPAVKRANIWLVQRPGDVIKERCDSKNIRRLQTRFGDKNIASTCTFNPQDVIWLLCWDHQDDPQCKELLTSGAGSIVVMTTPVCFLFVLVLVIRLY